MDNLVAAGIFFFGPLGLLLVALKNKWGLIFGLLGQLFFLTASYFDGMKGLFYFSLIQSFIWVIGIYVWFFKTGKK